MPKFFVKNNQVNDNKINIIGEDVNHISNVLRMQIGDEIQICDTDSAQNYLAQIETISKNEIKCKIIKEIESNVESKIYIHIFQGLPKADKMELIIQKSTELGVKEITPTQMERSIVKIDGKDAVKKVQRWQKIAEVAAKQSGRDIIPKINEIKNIKNVYQLCKNYDIVIVAYENEKTITLKQVLKQAKKENKFSKIAVVIGPEGGIDTKEIQNMQENGAKIITLGNRILRTETVALTIASIIMYEFEGEA